MDFVEKIKQVLFHPSVFFNQLPKEKGIGGAFTFIALFGLVYALLSSLVTFISQMIVEAVVTKQNSLFNQSFMNFGLTGPLSIVVGFLVSYIGLLVFSFVIVGILYLWLLLWGGKADYTETYKLWVYASTPQFLLGWIPFVSFLAWIYKVVLLVIGTEIIHKLSRTKAVFAYVIPIVLLIVLVIILMIIAMLMFGTAIMAGLF